MLIYKFQMPLKRVIKKLKVTLNVTLEMTTIQGLEGTLLHFIY